MNKNKPYVKLTLDVVMGITFALLNINFVKKITLRLFDKTLPGKTRLSYGLNVLLLVSMIFVIFSGLVISRVVLPSFQVGNEKMSKGPARMLMTGFAVAILLFGGYQMYSTHFISKLQMIGGVFSVSAAPAKQGDMQRPNFGEKPRMEGGSAASEGTGTIQENGSERRTMESPDGERGGSHQSQNFVNVIMAYFGIMAVFAGITYYADKWASRRKRVMAA